MVAKLAVVGSTNWDISLHLPRIPKPKETVTGGVSQFSLGGKGANQAVAAARAGAEVLFISALGQDAVAEQVRQQLSQCNMSIDGLISIDDAQTGSALIFVDQQGENCIGVADGANACLQPEHIDPFADQISQCSHTLIQLEIPMACVQHAAQLAYDGGSKVVLNPAPAALIDPALLALCHVITPNQIEMEQIIGFKINDKTLLAKACSVLLDKGPQLVIVTLGADGVFVASQDAQFTVGGYSVPVVDTTGAGDVFNGALTVAMAEGASIKEAAQFASAAAALSVGQAGAMSSIPKRSAIDDFMAQQL